MGGYAHFARHYDELMRDRDGGADPLANAERIGGYIARRLPRARSLLELGCGTGAVLAGLRGIDSLTGLDASPQMLERAAAKLPGARLIEADMTAFDLGERFDVVICVFDTVNHLPDFARWRALFERAAAHLPPGGLFAFDVNTVGQLRRLAAAEPWVQELAGGVRVTQHVEPADGGRFVWHVAISDALGVHRERIDQLGVELERIDAALAERFDPLERSDGQGSMPTDESRRAYLALRRR